VHLEVATIGAVFALLIASVVIASAARRFSLSPPITLVLAGVALSFVPGVPAYELEPELILFFVLPPLLYYAAWSSSLRGFRANLRPIALLSVGLVLATTVIVGLVMWAVVPGLPMAAAFAFGAIVAPPDAVSASAVGRRLGLPRRLMTVLSGESLVNDATALTAYRVAIAAVGGGVTLWEAGGMFLLAAVGGTAVGLLIGWLLHAARPYLGSPVLENALALFVPFVAFLAAEVVGASGVLAVVAAGLYLAQTSSRTTYAARLQGWSTWDLLNFILESVVFLLIGLQLRTVLGELEGVGVTQLVAWSALALVVVILVRVLWVFPAIYLPRWLVPSIRRRDPSPPWQWGAVLAWTGMRGVVSLAAAIALSADFPSRNLLVWLTFVVVLGTLVLQGLSLPWLIRRLGVTGQEADQDRLAAAAAQHRAARASIDRLEQELQAADAPAEIVTKLRAQAEHRVNAAFEQIGEPAADRAETPSAAYRRLRTAMLGAERDTFVELRDQGRIDDEVLRRLVRELDLEEAVLSRETAE
jgi:CPA1 family monovalent cation:H+ antiporter